MSRYLDMVDGPEHVKKLTVPQLQELAGEIRTELIEGLAKGGGHLGPNLGVVELTIALHKVFTTPKDKFVWDVSHQVYVHKILTGRKKRFRTINHNEWSIAKNVGAISGYLNKLITHPSYNKLAKEFEGFIRRLPKGDMAMQLAHRAEGGFKGAITSVGLQQTTQALDTDGRGGHGSPVFFEEMGMRYLGPIDGHNLPLLISTLEFAKQCDHPIVIHILTQKGKGYEAALKSPEKFHG